MPVIREAIHRHRCTSWTLSLAMLSTILLFDSHEAGFPLFEALLLMNAQLGVTTTLIWRLSNNLATAFRGTTVHDEVVVFRPLIFGTLSAFFRR